MTRKELNDIMKRNTIIPCEIDDVIAFVTELLEFKADELRSNEPYATRTIKDIVVSGKTAGIVYRDHVEIINL